MNFKNYFSISLLFLYQTRSIHSVDLSFPEFRTVRSQNHRKFEKYSIPSDVVRVGDMLLPTHYFVNGSLKIKSAVVDDHLLWDGAIVPYVVDESLSNSLTLIHDAMEQYHQHTCVKFVPRTNQPNYLVINEGQGGCATFVGNNRVGPQSLGLGRGCLFVGTIVHELGHTIGFFHEHDRSDRDENIVIHWDNVEKGTEMQFAKMEPSKNRLLTPYNTNSIMHYGETAFSKDGHSKTMTSKFGLKFENPFDKQGLDSNDIIRINMLYHC